MLAVVAVVAAEALAHTGAVVAKTTARAITAFICALSSNRIVVTGALDEAAVRPTEAVIAFATVVVLGIPGGVVLSGDVLLGVVGDVVTGELLQ